MRICFLSYHSCPYSLLGSEGTGGMSVYLRELSQALSNCCGAKIDILTRRQMPSLKKIKEVAPDIRLIHLKDGPEFPVDRKILLKYIPHFTKEAESFIEAEGFHYDIIHSHYWLSGLVGEKLRQKFGGILFHSYHTMALLKKETLLESEHPSRVSSEQGLAFSSDGIVCNCGEEKKALEKFLGIPCSKARVVYPGINHRLFLPVKAVSLINSQKAGDITFLYVGRIEPVKGLRTVLEALSLLKRYHPDKLRLMKLLVVGGGRVDDELQKNPEVKSLRQFVFMEGLENNVSFLGSIKQVGLNKYYSSVDALIVPSYYESFGLVAGEALACGTPVIASRTGGLKSIVKPGKNGFYFTPGNPESLARVLVSFPEKTKTLWNPEIIRKDTVKRFDWKKTAEEIMDFYRDVKQKESQLKTRLPLGEMLLQA